MLKYPMYGRAKGIFMQAFVRLGWLLRLLLVLLLFSWTNFRVTALDESTLGSKCIKTHVGVDLSLIFCPNIGGVLNFNRDVIFGVNRVLSGCFTNLDTSAGMILQMGASFLANCLYFSLQHFATQYIRVGLGQEDFTMVEEKSLNSKVAVQGKQDNTGTELVNHTTQPEPTGKGGALHHEHGHGEPVEAVGYEVLNTYGKKDIFYMLAANFVVKDFTHCLFLTPSKVFYFSQRATNNKYYQILNHNITMLTVLHNAENINYEATNVKMLTINNLLNYLLNYRSGQECLKNLGYDDNFYNRMLIASALINNLRMDFFEHEARALNMFGFYLPHMVPLITPLGVCALAKTIIDFGELNVIVGLNYLLDKNENVLHNLEGIKIFDVMLGFSQIVWQSGAYHAKLQIVGNFSSHVDNYGLGLSVDLKMYFDSVFSEVGVGFVSKDSLENYLYNYGAEDRNLIYFSAKMGFLL